MKRTDSDPLCTGTQLIATGYPQDLLHCSLLNNHSAKGVRPERRIRVRVTPSPILSLTMQSVTACAGCTFTPPPNNGHLLPGLEGPTCMSLSTNSATSEPARVSTAGLTTTRVSVSVMKEVVVTVGVETWAG